MAEEIGCCEFPGQKHILTASDKLTDKFKIADGYFLA